MDSALLSHQELSGSRFHAVKAKGEYGSTGMRYPQEMGGHYEKAKSLMLMVIGSKGE